MKVERHPTGAAAQVQRPAREQPAHRFLLHRDPLRVLREVPPALSRGNETALALNDLGRPWRSFLAVPVELVQEHVAERIPVGAECRDLFTLRFGSRAEPSCRCVRSRLTGRVRDARGDALPVG
jgi:hypothetical protein